MNGRTAQLVLLVGILLALIYGLYGLLAVRLQKGDIYPPYSSLRADPLGTKVLFDALDSPGIPDVRRNYGPLDKLTKPEEDTLFDLGEDPWEGFSGSSREVADLETFLVAGGRVVVAFQSVNEGADGKVKRPTKGILAITTPTPSVSVTPSVTQTPTVTSTVTPFATSTPSATHVPTRTVGKIWGVELGAETLPKDSTKGYIVEEDRYQPVTVQREGTGSLPAALPWHSAAYFKDIDPAWKVIYRRGANPVIIERTVGKGILVCLTDTYLLSNEAMQDDRYPELLSYLAGDRPTVIFDETHLGVNESVNTAVLARQYGLGGLAGGLLALAGLFVWRSSSRLAPPVPEKGKKLGGRREGKDHASGLVNLLKRNIAGRDILEACFEEWKRTFGSRRPFLAPKVREMEAQIDAAKGKDGKKTSSPVELYRKLSRILNQRR